MPENQNITKLETHRFQVPEHSMDALHQFREQLTTFMAEHPEIVGTTVYGSHNELPRGRAGGVSQGMSPAG